MGTKFFATILITITVLIAIFSGAPQQAWQWFQASSIGTEVYSWLNGHENLSGLLKGPIDGSANSYLASVGIVKWTNNQRESQGLGPLHNNALLQKAAENKLADMFAKQYFEHESPDGKLPSDLSKAVGYSYVIVGENLALGNFKDDQTLVQAWMDSPGHRANILHSHYEEIGVAVGKGIFEGKEVWLAVQEFGQPLSSCPSPATGAKVTLDSNRSEIAFLESQLQQKKADVDAKRSGNNSGYQQAVNEYNAIAEKINRLSSETKTLVQKYNDSVNDFNACLESSSGG